MASHLRLIDAPPFEEPNHLYYGDNLTIMRQMRVTALEKAWSRDAPGVGNRETQA